MSNPKFACIIPGCNKTTAAHHIVKHILAHQRSEVKAKLDSTLAIGVRGSLIRMNIKVEGVANNFQVCLGCNKIFRKIPLQVAHQESCPNKQKHKEVCKSFITSEPVALSESDVVLTPSEDVSKLKKDNDRLKKELQLIKEDNDKLSGFEQAFINLAKSYKEHIPYDSFMTTLQDEDSVLYDSIIGYLDDE